MCDKRYRIEWSSGGITYAVEGPTAEEAVRLYDAFDSPQQEDKDNDITED